MGASSRRHTRAGTAARLALGTLVLALMGTLLAPVSAVAAREPAAASVPSRYLNQPVSWEPCYFDEFFRAIEPDAPVTLCTNVVVPMDWRHPDAHPDITLAIAYSQATRYSKGLLTSNPGGPGANGLNFTGLLALTKTQLFRDYDLLGFDPRGFGDSENIRCLTTEAKLQALPQVDDPRVRNTKSHKAELAVAKLLGQACTSTEFAQFVNTQQTAYDMDFLREFLGRDHGGYKKLNYIGYSYGTWLGTWYADTYPSRVGRFILDSNMNWTRSMYANQLSDSFSFQRRRDLMFYPWLARHHKQYGMGTTTAKVAKSYETIRANLLRAYRRGDFVPSPADADAAILNQLYADWQFEDAANTLFDFKLIGAGGGDAAARRRVAALRADSRLPYPLVRRDAQGPAVQEEMVEIYGAGGDAVRCNDSRYSRNLTTLLKRSDADAKKYRFVGYLNTVSMCSYWKFPSTTRTIDLAGVPRMLMFQSEGDPATSYEGALEAHKKTSAHTRLVSVDNEGQHALYIDGPSPCVDKLGDDWLFRGKMATKDMVCGTTPLPLDTRVYSFTGPLNGRSYRLDERANGTRTVGGANEALRKAREQAAGLQRP